MKSNYKQKQPTVQALLNAAQSGGGSGGESYTKAEADAKFQTIAGMSGYVAGSGNYFTWNGIRVYVSSTEPTGDIPDGSIWIGG